MVAILKDYKICKQLSSLTRVSFGQYFSVPFGDHFQRNGSLRREIRRGLGDVVLRSAPWYDGQWSYMGSLAEESSAEDNRNPDTKAH